jgi:hypothetical protein
MNQRFLLEDGRWMLEENTLVIILANVILRESQSDEPKDIISQFSKKIKSPLNV